MLKTQNLQAPVMEIGEDIGLELGKIMIQNFQALHPNEIPSFLIGKRILTEILNQPNCEGIRVYNGYNEIGEKTVVCVGTDKEAKNIVEICSIDSTGKFTRVPGIVADRVKPGGLPMGRPGEGGTLPSPDEWEWSID